MNVLLSDKLLKFLYVIICLVFLVPLLLFGKFCLRHATTKLPYQNHGSYWNSDMPFSFACFIQC
uniref:Uncharacterized protein n=1 Tax=Arundo donax TaxID=35708 RepID=A0A0A9HXR5_ARUDO